MAKAKESKTTARKTTVAATKVRGLVKQMNMDAQAASVNGEPIAYCFIMSFYDEIIRAMGITPVWTENFAGLCAAKRDADRFLQSAKKDGYPNDLCTYALCGLGFDIMRNEIGGVPPNSPDGGMAMPTVMLGSGMMICDPRYKWYQAAQRYLDVPMYAHNLLWPPYPCDLKEVEGYYVKFLVKELQGLVDFLEKQTGKKMNWDRLSEVVDIAERTLDIWWKAYNLRKAVPAPMPSEDAFNTMVPGWFMLGTQDALDFYTELHDEIKQRVEQGIGVIPDEKYRVLWANGLPPWHSMMMLNYFESLGAVFPIEAVYKPWDPVEIPASVTNPLERIAQRLFKAWTFRYEKADRNTRVPEVELLLEWIDMYKIDGILMHRAFSCRTVHVGEIHQLKVLREHCDLPHLVLESDMIDVTSFSEEKVKTQIEAFVETMDAAKGHPRM
ncbi:MAG: 2-hydroxyacyl-CoA dehydratase [Syntrophaceae bacterium]|nr:2-hydroxyacyl-CoA dehydratase [Syntrophaceae bacterium]